MSSESKHTACFIIGLVFGFLIGFFFGAGFGASDATRNIEFEAVRKGRAEWVQNEYGAPVFKWKVEAEK